MRLWFITGMISVIILSGVAIAQEHQRMWYIGPFEGWVDRNPGPVGGYYYRPSPDSLYPLNEASYGEPVPCLKCGHIHWPGSKQCAYCGCVCPQGGNKQPENSVYSSQRLSGMYFYEQQPHFRFKSPMRLGPFQKYRYAQ